MAERSRRSETIEDPPDDDSYEPSNEGDPDINNEDQGYSPESIRALDYVDADHPLLPPPRSRILDSAESLKNRTRRHPAFWWEVCLTMQKRAQPNQSRDSNEALRAQITGLKKENEELRREKDQGATTDESLIAEVAKR